MYNGSGDLDVEKRGEGPSNASKLENGRDHFLQTCHKTPNQAARDDGQRDIVVQGFTQVCQRNVKGALDCLTRN